MAQAFLRETKSGAIRSRAESIANGTKKRNKSRKCASSDLKSGKVNRAMGKCWRIMTGRWWSYKTLRWMPKESRDSILTYNDRQLPSRRKYKKRRPSCCQARKSICRRWGFAKPSNSTICKPSSSHKCSPSSRWSSTMLTGQPCTECRSRVMRVARTVLHSGLTHTNLTSWWTTVIERHPWPMQSRYMWKIILRKWIRVWIS